MAARRSTLGVPGASARAQYLSRQAAREQRSGKGVQPQHELAWLLGAEGEELLADMLSEALADTTARLLHDRRVPETRGNIDHIVVASSGVFVIDAKNYGGPIEKRVNRAFSRILSERLFVNGRDCTRLLEGLRRQGQATTEALEDLPGQPVQVHLMLCFVNGHFPQLGVPIVEGVPSLSPRVLLMELRKPGPLGTRRIAKIARHLDSALPCANPVK